LPTRKRRLYWDSGCFIALFNKEPTTPQVQLDALQATFEEMLAGRIRIITSDIYRVEVFGADKGQAAKVAEQFEACPYFEIVPLRTLATTMAGEMRKRCHAAKPVRKLKTPDALHIASGTIARAEEIWTTDHDLVKYYEANLLTKTKVCLPYLKQLRILY
jgi:predicted nucleic acid-binding protein